MTTAAPSPVSREKLITTARLLPATPQVLAQLGRLLQDVNTELDQIASLLKKDASLAARVIRISNSAAVSGGARIGSVEEAVNRVGFGEVYRLVGIAAAGRMAERELNFYLVGAEQLRLHMLYTALAAETLAKKVGLDAREAYTAGLMRPIGMMVIDRIARERLKPEEVYSPSRFEGYVAWETATFGVSNPEATAQILGDWKFPLETMQAIQNHYLLRKTDQEDYLACLLNLASHMTMMAGLGFTGEPSYWDLTQEKLDRFKFTTASFEALQPEVDALYEKAKTIG